MLQWAASSVEGSVNAAAMPHAIIVLNFTDPNIHPDGWTVESATTSLLNTYAKAVYENADVKTHAQYWQQRDRPINSTKDLLLCYYSSVSVVRIPQKGRYGLVDKQISELNQQVHKRCKEARQNRRQLRIIFNAEEFQAALSMGFDHFSNRLDEPFDFVELSWNLNPIPKDFGGNILRLALAIKDDPKMAGATGPQIFQHLGHMVASCVMLDYVRHQIKGITLLVSKKPANDAQARRPDYSSTTKRTIAERSRNFARIGGPVLLSIGVLDASILNGDTSEAIRMPEED